MPRSDPALNRARALVFLAVLSALIGSTAPSPLYSHYQSSLGFTSTTLTALFAVYAVGVLLALGLFGRLSDRLADRRIVLVPALLVVASGSLVFAFSTQLDGLFLGRFLAGIGTGALTGSANAALVGFDSLDGKKQAALLATLSFTCGAAFGPVLSALAIALKYAPTITPFVFNAALALLTAIGLCRVAWRAEAPSSHAQPDQQRPGLGQTMSGRWGVFSRISLLLMVAWSVGSVFVALGPTMFLRTVGAVTTNSHALSGLLVTAFQVVAGMTQLLCRRARAEWAMTGGGACICLAWLGCLVALHIHQPVLFVAATVLSGVGYGAAFVGTMGVFTALAPSAHRAVLGSLFYLTGYLGSALSIVAMGAAVDALGMLSASAIMLLVLVVSLGYLIFAGGLMHKQKGSGEGAS